MANALTGDFDIVAQFSVPAANRLLAAMHRTERFPHSLAIRVDDTAPLDPGRLHPSAVGAVDIRGEAIANHQQIGTPNPFPTLSPTGNGSLLAFGGVVNIDGLVLENIEVEPSNLRGRAQLQLFPPTIEIPDNSGKNLLIRIEVLARYFPDPNTSALAEFIRGELTITAPVNKVASQSANVVEIDIKGAAIGINFVPEFSSRPFTPSDLLGIKLLIRNALRTSFVPSSSPLPPGVGHIQFRTLRSPAPALAVLLDVSGGAGNSASATNVFLGTDDFAFGVAAEHIHAKFQPTLDKILSTPVEPIKFDINGLVHTWHITYQLKLSEVSVALKEGELVLTVKGRARTEQWPPNFDFTSTISFTLGVSGDNVDLVAGDVSIDTSSWIINRFRGKAEAGIRKVRDRALSQSGANAAIRDALSADKNVGGLIDSLLKPARDGSAPPLPKGFRLRYSGADIHPSGIVLHGVLSLVTWPVPHVEFEQIPSQGGEGPGPVITGVLDGPDYSALKTWIPGGTVDRYEWKAQGSTQPGFMDEHRFVLLHQPQATTGRTPVNPLTAFTPLCLTVHGSRLSHRGQVQLRPVSGTICGIHHFPLPGELGTFETGLTIALVEPTPDGGVEVGGHAQAQPSGRGRVAPNVIVHFGDSRSAGTLDVAVNALRESGRSDASTALLAVLSPDELSRVRHTPGITYASDGDGAWRRHFKVDKVRTPLTIVVAPNGKTIYEQEGSIDGAKLAEELRKSLVSGGRIEPSLNPVSVRFGQLPPNFLFEHARGHDVTLRKIAGRPVAVVFWRSSSAQSIDLLERLGKLIPRNGEPATLVLAVNDGESPDLARKVFAEHKVNAVLVPDPLRRIATAYGVIAWPTTVWIDELGLVRAVRLGSLGTDASKSPFDQESETGDKYSSGQRSDGQ